MTSQPAPSPRSPSDGTGLLIVFMTGVFVRAVERVLEHGTVASPKLPAPPRRNAPAEAAVQRAPTRPLLGH